MGPEPVTSTGEESVPLSVRFEADVLFTSAANSSRAIPTVTQKLTNLLSGAARINLKTFLVNLPE